MKHTIKITNGEIKYKMVCEILTTQVFWPQGHFGHLIFDGYTATLSR